MTKRKISEESTAPTRRSARARRPKLTWTTQPEIETQDCETVSAPPKRRPNATTTTTKTTIPKKTGKTAAKPARKKPKPAAAAVVRPKKSSKKKAVVPAPASSSDDDDDDDDADDDDDDRIVPLDNNNETNTQSDNDDSVDDDSAPPEEEEQPASLYEVGQKILARDQDGLLYQGMVRRKLWGVHHHKQVQVGMVTCQEEIQALLEQEQQPTWHYFVHYFQWNVNWDRWVSQDDVLELTDANIELSKTVHFEHKTLMKQFKQHSKHIDGGAFLKAWQERLQKLLGQDDDNELNAKKRSKQRQRRAAQTKKLALVKQAQLQKQSLWNRPPTQAQQLVLNFGLKKVLVEDWELIVHFNNLHALPAKEPQSVYHVLKSYLKETKGIEMKEEEPPKPAAAVVPEAAKSDDSSTNVGQNENSKKDGDDNDSDEAMTTERHSSRSNDDNEDDKNVDEAKANTSSLEHQTTTETNDSNDPTTTTADEKQEQETTTTREDAQEWLDMATGICMLFDEALSFRLLYPSEQAQLLVLEKLYPDTPKSQLYGCEFLLRLFCQLPALLADTYKNKKTNRQEGDGNEEEEEQQQHNDVIKPILAKVYDFLRYLQTNQSKVFQLAYRKPNSDEVRQQTKLDKKKARKAMAMTKVATA